MSRAFDKAAHSAVYIELLLSIDIPILIFNLGHIHENPKKFASGILFPSVYTALAFSFNKKSFNRRFEDSDFLSRFPSSVFIGMLVQRVL